MKTLAILRTVPRLGIRRCVLNVSHRAKLKAGRYRILTPLRPWESFPLGELRGARSPFRVPDADIATVIGNPEEVGENADRVLRSDYLYFSTHWLKRPADWKTHPVTGFVPSDQHWTDARVTARDGDVKWIWEPSRFEWVYLLARAWAVGRDERFAEGFWSLLEDWRANNPPNRGVNWSCGQECAIRLFALAFAAAAFRDARATTGRRMELLWQTVSALATRIEPSIGYAVSQNNNHGLAEAAALYVAGVSLLNHASARRWRERGKRLFERQVTEQFSLDGAYVLHSTNYAREALRDCVVFLIAARFAGDSVPPVPIARIRAGVEFLWQLQDASTGRLPNYGANDGSNIASLSSAPYEDFRPLLQVAHYLVDGRRMFRSGLHDEELAWHFGTAAASSTEVDLRDRTQRFSASAGGYYVIRQGSAFAMLRCHTFNTRPGHADMLHFDLWCDGENVVADGGTFQYHDPTGIGSHLESTAAHNTLVVDGESQMNKISPFLWSDWTRSRLVRFGSGGAEAFVGEHYAYRKRGVVHRRSVYADGGEWLVIDDAIVDDRAPHDLELRWHLVGDWRLDDKIATDARGRVVQLVGPSDHHIGLLQGEENLPHTARSLRYGDLSDRSVLRARYRSSSSIRWATAFGSSPLEVANGRMKWRTLELSTEVANESI